MYHYRIVEQELDILAREGQVGGEVNLARLGLLVGIVIDHDDCADGTREADGIDLGEVQRHDGIAVLDGCLLEHVLSRVVDVNVAVELLRPATSFHPGPIVEVAESYIVAEAALARLSKPRHLAEVDASRYGKVTNYGLDIRHFGEYCDHDGGNLIDLTIGL